MLLKVSEKPYTKIKGSVFKQRKVKLCHWLGSSTFIVTCIYAAENGVQNMIVRSQEPWKVRLVATSRTNFHKSLTNFLRRSIFTSKFHI